MPPDDLFAQLDQAHNTGGAEAALQALTQHCLDTHNYPLLFEVRLMQSRLQLALPLIHSGSRDDLPPDKQRPYEEAFLAAARETGQGFLDRGEIARAWPYFRAIGDPAPVASVIENYEPGEDRQALDAVIEIALLEAVSPVKGFRLILQHHGICRAITSFGQFPVRQGRAECARLLIATLHGELIANLKRAIAQQEEREPAAADLTGLLQDRDWLFGEYSYHVDTSHLVSVLQISLDLDDVPCLEKALDLALYGQHLASTFQHRGDPPFEDVYTDHAIFLRALLGIDADAAIGHFRSKAQSCDPAVQGPGPAQVLIGLLSRLGRKQEAVDASLEFLPSSPASFELCQASGDFERLRRLAQERGDALAYVAGLIQQ
ncbi:MAG: hypothetical protein JJE04_11830 [Acidobacteriia bacterium]|nr:hypothetical protein [Terriglobia bacterium]